MQPVHTQKCSWNQRINGTAEHCCICIPGRACVERFVDLLAAPSLRLYPSNAYVQATLAVGSVNFCTVDFGGVFFNSFCCVPYLSGTSGSCQHGAFSHFFRLFSTFGVMHQNVVTLGGVCVCFSKSVGKRRFRNVWVGGGRWSQFCAPSCTREDTQGTGNGPGITHYSESDSLSSLPLSARAGTPLGHTSPCL